MDKIAIKSKYENELKLRNYSKETLKSYNYFVNDFLKNAQKIDNAEVKRYLLKTINNKKKHQYV